MSNTALSRRHLLWCAGFLALVGSTIAWQATRQAEWAAANQERVGLFAASRWRIAHHRSLPNGRHEFLLERADDPRDSFSLVVHEAIYARNRFDTIGPGNLIAFERRPADDASCTDSNGVDCFLLPQIVSR